MSTSVSKMGGGVGSGAKSAVPAGELNNKHASPAALNISTEKFLAFVGELIGGPVGRDDDEHPLPPGPWDPIIRAALEQTYLLEVSGPWPQPWRISGPGPNPWAGPQPDPWFLDTTGFTAGSHSKILLLATILARHPEIYDAVGGGHNPGSKVALNPQPLPPRVHFMVSVAKIVIARAELLNELAGAMTNPGERQGIIIVGGYVNKFCDDVCGNGFRIPWRFPGPRPSWLTEELTGLDLVVLAAEFHQAAKQALSSDLRQSLSDASAKLVEAGVSKME